jgi:hypothetical protein
MPQGLSHVTPSATAAKGDAYIGRGVWGPLAGTPRCGAWRHRTGVGEGLWYLFTQARERWWRKASLLWQGWYLTSTSGLWHLNICVVTHDIGSRCPFLRADSPTVLGWPRLKAGYLWVLAATSAWKRGSQ